MNSIELVYNKPQGTLKSSITQETIKLTGSPTSTELMLFLHDQKQIRTTSTWNEYHMCGPKIYYTVDKNCLPKLRKLFQTYGKVIIH